MDSVGSDGWAKFRRSRKCRRTITTARVECICTCRGGIRSENDGNASAATPAAADFNVKPRGNHLFDRISTRHVQMHSTRAVVIVRRHFASARNFAQPSLANRIHQYFRRCRKNWRLVWKQSGFGIQQQSRGLARTRCDLPRLRMNALLAFVRFVHNETASAFHVFPTTISRAIAPVISASFPVFMAGGNNTWSN